MAINTTTRQTTAFTSGQTFAFAFKVYEEGDVKVIRITNSTGAEEVLTITTHYTVTLNDDQNANPGGSITLVSSGSPVNLGSGFSIVITSKVTPLQQTEITNQGGFFPEVINDVLDKAAILDQQQQAILDKTIRFPLTQTVGGLEITENAANRANKTLVFDGSGDLSVSATVDGRDVSADGAKLDTIEANAKDDQTAAEIRALVESASDSNVFTDADHTKLNGIEAGATGDLSASEVKALYEGNTNTNAFTDALVSKLNNIEAGATGDQSASEIRTLVQSANDSNVFTDNDHNKLDGIEAGATADQTSGDIKTLLQSDKLTHLELANDSVRVSQIQDSQITAAKLDPAAVITASEQASATPNDTSFLTSAAADARFFNVSTGDTIKDGDTFPDNDTTIATTAAINDRIIDLVDDVGGFVPIANETSFPTANPDAENGTGTVVSVKEASTNLTPSGTTVTIANGAGTGNTVTITGVPSVIPSGFGFIVETTTTLHTYTFHRLTPKATEVTTVAGKAVEIGRLGTADAVADMAILGTTDVVADMNMLATTDIVADMALLATTDVIADMALLAVTDVISDMNDLATSANITAMANCSNSISSITNASNNLSSVNNFGDTYQVAANDPQYDGGGNALSEGDLYFNTNANRLKVYDGSSWVNGVEISSAGAVTTGNTFTGDNRYNDGVKALFGTGSDFGIYHDGNNGVIDNNTGDLYITTVGSLLVQGTGGDNIIKYNSNGAVELYHDNSKKFETTSTGIKVLSPSANPDIKITGALGSGAEHRIFVAGSNSESLQITGNTRLFLNANDINFRDASTTVDLFTITSNGDVNLPRDNKKLQLGASQDLQLYHTGSANHIDSVNGALAIRSDVFQISTLNGTHVYLNIPTNEQGVELYYDGSKKLETTSDGAKVSGNLTVDNGTGSTITVEADSGGEALFLATGGANQQATAAIELMQSTTSLQGGGMSYNGDGTPAWASGESSDHITFYRRLNGARHEVFSYPFNNNNVTFNGNILAELDGVTDIGANATRFNRVFADALYGKVQDTTFTSAVTIDVNGTDEGSTTLLTLDNYIADIGAEYTFIDFTFRDSNDNATPQVKIGAQAQDIGGGQVAEGTADFVVQCGVGNSSTANTMTEMFRCSHDTKITSVHHEPQIDSAFDLGTNTVRWRNVYADTLYGDGSNLTGINTDLVSDTTPQLGGDLDFNGNNALLQGAGSNTGTNWTSDSWEKIVFDASYGNSPASGPNKIVLHNDTAWKAGFGVSSDQLNLYAGDGSLVIYGQADNNSMSNIEEIARFKTDQGVTLRYDGSTKFETTSSGASITGDLGIGLTTAAAGYSRNAQIHGSGNGAALKLTDVNTGSGNGDGFDLIAYDVHGYCFLRETGNLYFATSGTTRAYFTSSGDFLPNVNNTYSLGSSSNRWANIYTNDLNLSNEGGKNDVDGTWGSYTIQEGAEDLYLINKRNGKKYKFALMEVS